LNLEHHRKDAKRLLRAARAGAPEALARVADVLGENTDDLQLSDALHVIAREQGYRSWPELKHAAEQGYRSWPELKHAAEQGYRSWPELKHAAEQPPADPRMDTTIDTALEYRPGDPVRVRVVRRGRRVRISDEGGAFERAGRPRAWQQAAQKVERELVVNFSRSGVISLPVVPVGPSEKEVVQRIAEASRAFYQELLEVL
jgi:hypothetical protein